MIKIDVASVKNPKTIVSIRLDAKKTVEGNIIIYDHPHLDLFLDANNGKIIAMPKVKIDDEIYSTMDRLFRYLRKEGVIVSDSVQGGNTFYSMEAKIPASSEFGDPIQFVLYSIFRFLEDDLPEVEFVDKVRDIHKKELVDPSADDSTELGEVPPNELKGNLDQKVVPWGTAYRSFREGLNKDDQILLESIMKSDYRQSLAEQILYESYDDERLRRLQNLEPDNVELRQEIERRNLRRREGQSYEQVIKQLEEEYAETLESFQLFGVRRVWEGESYDEYLESLGETEPDAEEEIGASPDFSEISELTLEDIQEEAEIDQDLTVKEIREIYHQKIAEVIANVLRDELYATEPSDSHPSKHTWYSGWYVDYYPQIRAEETVVRLGDGLPDDVYARIHASLIRYRGW